jgi:hypothetical protein
MPHTTIAQLDRIAASRIACITHNDSLEHGVNIGPDVELSHS